MLVVTNKLTNIFVPVRHLTNHQRFHLHMVHHKLLEVTSTHQAGHKWLKFLHSTFHKSVPVMPSQHELPMFITHAFTSMALTVSQSVTTIFFVSAICHSNFYSLFSSTNQNKAENIGVFSFCCARTMPKLTQLEHEKGPHSPVEWPRTKTENALVSGTSWLQCCLSQTNGLIL